MVSPTGYPVVGLTRVTITSKITMAESTRVLYHSIVDKDGDQYVSATLTATEDQREKIVLAKPYVIPALFLPGIMGTNLRKKEGKDIAWRPPNTDLRGAADAIAQLFSYLFRNAKDRANGMFIERALHANGSVTLISWNRPTGDILYRFDTYFRAGSRTLKYSGDVDPDRKNVILASCDRLAKEWHELPDSEIPKGIGYVVNDAILAANRFNLESWRMVIQLAGKPAVSFKITAYTQRTVEPGLRERAGGLLAGLLGAAAGFTQLRSRERPVGLIQADEILVAGTQDGKRTYGFKWEAPAKADSLAEPNLNVSLQVGECAYLTQQGIICER